MEPQLCEHYAGANSKAIKIENGKYFAENGQKLW